MQEDISLVEALQIIAPYVAYPLVTIGWFFFLLGVFFLLAAPQHAQTDAQVFRYGGYLVVPGWLLLRFAAGLFPFGRRFFKWQQ